MMQSLTTLTALFLLLVGPFLGECWGAPPGLAPKADLYVSVDGSDTWSDRLPAWSGHVTRFAN